MLDFLRDVASKTETDLDDKAVAYLRRRRTNLRFVWRNFRPTCIILLAVGALVGFGVGAAF